MKPPATPARLSPGPWTLSRSAGRLCFALLAAVVCPRGSAAQTTQPAADLPAPVWATALAVAVPAPPGARRAPADEEARAVDAAVEKAVQFLYAQQRGGNWEALPAPVAGARGITGAQWGEPTALSTAALLAAGESPRDPRLARAIEWLVDAPLRTPSVAAWRGQALAGLFAAAQRAAADEPARRAVERLQRVIERDLRLLLKSVLYAPDHAMPAGLYPPEDGEAAASAGATGGAGGATVAGRAPAYDLEVSQTATAGMVALDSVDPGGGTFGYWLLVGKPWRIVQNPDGSWASGANVRPSARAGATAAAVATLISIDDRLGPPDSVKCRPVPFDVSVEKGTEWLRKRARDAIGDYPAMWSVRRMLLLSGGKDLESVDWSREAIEYLLRHQLPDGSWPAAAGADPDGRRLAETAYAVFLLTSYRAPVAINKLSYDAPTGGRGNPFPGTERSRDAAHLLEWSGWQLGLSLNWQWVPPDDADALEEAPILSITGSQRLAFAPADLDRLRAYVEHGGMIVGNANCDSKAFADSFTQLGRALFPHYAFRDLPPEHPLLSGQRFHADQWAHPPTFQGLSNGVRELMLLPAGDASGAWQSRTFVRPWFEAGFDLLSYAQDPAVWPRRGERRVIRRDPKVHAGATIRLARLLVGDNPDPEPGGWQRLAGLMHNQFQTDLEVTPVHPGDGSLTRAKDPFRVAHLTGTTRLALSPEARDELKTFVNNGGTLIADAAGGSSAFADSAAGELAQLFPPPRSMEVLAPDDGVYQLKGAKIGEFRYRRFAAGRMEGDARRPHLRGLAVGGRTAVFFSREDLSAGLVGQDVDGVIGYAPETATEIMRNILLSVGGAPQAPQQAAP